VDHLIFVGLSASIPRRLNAILIESSVCLFSFFSVTETFQVLDQVVPEDDEALRFANHCKNGGTFQKT